MVQGIKGYCESKRKLLALKCVLKRFMGF